MHAGQDAYTTYPQLDGENEIAEIVCRDYPHPKRVAVDDLSSEDQEVLESVSAPTRTRRVGGPIFFTT